MDPTKDLSRRERQIMQVVFANGRATAKEIVGEISDPPSRTAVRTILTILEEKKFLKHKRVGREFVYSPTTSREKASRGALQSVLRTFFGGSIENLVASHFADPNANLDEETLERMERMISDARAKEADPPQVNA
ncbi:MAG: BlaI/MecI/CopY family transcriptional regulator [Mariniblastus sp.]